MRPNLRNVNPLVSRCLYFLRKMVYPFEETARTGHIVFLISHPLTPSSVLYTFGLNTGEFSLDIY